MIDLTTTSGPRATFPMVRLLGSWALSIAIVGLGVAQQAIGRLNGDNSWFITFAEKVAGGARAYVDIGDPNPPMGFIAYMPAVVAARLTGLRAEAWTVVELLAIAALSIWLAGLILRNSWSGNERGLLRNAALWVLLVGPAFGFAEREHFALLACLPIIAAGMTRSDRRGVPTPLALAAGVGGGIALAFKPYYAIPLAAASLVTYVRRRSIAALLTPENICAASAYALYLGAVALVWPEYFSRVLPLAIEVYAPARYPLSLVIASPPFLFNAAMLAAFVFFFVRFGASGGALVLAAASAGFLATYVLQAKIWFNHAYPGIALAGLALAALAIDLRERAPDAAGRLGRLCVIPALVCMPFLGAAATNLTAAEEYPGLTAAVRANGPARPKIAIIAEQLDVGHPLTRRVDGVWIGRQNALWVNNCVRQILSGAPVDAERSARLLSYARAERNDLALDITAGRPDIVLVESPALREWALATPELAHALDGYVQRAKVGEIELWARAPAH